MKHYIITFFITTGLMFSLSSIKGQQSIKDKLKIQNPSQNIWLSKKSKEEKNNFCGQYEMEKINLQQNPEIKQRRYLLEKFTADFTTNYYSNLAQNKIQSHTILFVIPVVFHIMHNYGPENISKAQIMDAMRIINEDYQKLNADTSQVIPFFQPIIGDCQVEFRLAQLDPLGNCTDGITRHQTLLTNGGDDSLKTIVQWPPDKYLNIWVENYIGWGNFAAYAYLPGALPIQDGIVFAHSYLGTIGTSVPANAHILSHEIGHFFNLNHTWGPTNTPGDITNCNLDDGVSDTPITIGTTVCNTNMLSCTPNVLANVQNMMEYSWCQLMFTQGQVVRMQACINDTISNRNNLWTAANRLLTGTNDSFSIAICTPIADFSVKTIHICEGQNVTFYNQSYGGDFTTIHWEFIGGNITSSTDTNPTIQYNTAGVYNVTLTVTNSAGSSTLVRNALVDVGPAIANTLAPTVQDFKTLVFPTNNWNYENTRGTHWEITNLASVSGTNSIYLQNDSTNISTNDIFYTESYNFRNITSPVFNFKVAFANKNTSNDNLKIFMSTNCGQTWSLKYSKSGNSLATVNDTALNFIPTTNQWRQDAINISAAAGQGNVRFKFQFTSDGGNNIFIDDINITVTLGFEEISANAINLSLSPNPASQPVSISFELPTSTIVSYSVTDITGRIILKNKPEKLSEGKHSLMIENKFSAGLFFIVLKAGENHYLMKVVFN